MKNISHNKDTKPYLDLIEDFLSYCMSHLECDEDCSIIFIDDKDNAENSLGNTGYYNPENKEVGIFTTNRHIKDILRSLGHEMVHHEQNSKGKINSDNLKEPGYAQKDKDLRNIEKDAYVRGNLLLRDYEDTQEASDQENLNESFNRKSNRYEDKFGFRFQPA